MTSKEAQDMPQSTHFFDTRTKWVSAALTTLALAGVFFGSRWLWGPDSANAQTPRNGAAKPEVTNGGARGAAPAAANPAQKQPVSRASASVTPKENAAAVTNAAATQSVMAVVNNEQISRDQLSNECLRRFGTEVLESIVNKHLIWQECQAKGITISEKDVEEEIARAAANFGLSSDRYLAMLRDERGIPPDRYRRDIVWPMIALRRLAAGQIEVTQQELQESFEAKYGPQVKIRAIAVSSPDKANQILREVTAKPDQFGNIAKEKSEDPNSAAASGQLPPICKHVGDPEIERVAFSLKEGQISPVVHAANQYLILKCDQHIKETYVPSTQMKQIEARLRDEIRDNKMRESAGKIYQRLQSESKVVNVLNNPQLSKQMPGVAATINDSKITTKQLADECILRHGSDVLEGEINRKLLEQELKRNNKSVTQRDIDSEIARAADSYGFSKKDGTPDVEAWLKAVMETEHVTVDLYVRDSVWPSVALKSIVGNNIQVSQEDLKKGFDSNYGERVEVLAIVLSNQRQASQVWDLARGNATDQGFGELAQQYSVEPVSRSNFGRVPPIRKFGGQPVLEEEAFKLRPGELSGIIAVADKFVILRCLGHTKPVVSDFNAVAEELRKDIQEKKVRIAMAEEFDRIRESAQIDNYLDGTTQSGKKIASRPASPAASVTPAAGPSTGKAATPAPRSSGTTKVAPAAANLPKR